MKTPRVLVPLLLGLLAAGGAASAGEAQPALNEPPSSRADAEPLVLPSAPTPAPAPRWAASGAAEDGGYRLSLSRGSLDLGVRFEPRVTALRPLDARYEGAAPLEVTLPSLSFGLRSVAAGAAPASTLAERALGTSTSVPAVSKVGIEWKPAQSQVFFHQGVGFRLGGDDRLVMRLRKSSLGIYMQRTF